MSTVYYLTRSVTDVVPVGTILGYVGATAPPRYLLCNGTRYSVAEYPLLASVLGVPATDTFFVVPNLSERVLYGTGTQVPTLRGTQGARNVALEAKNLPKHTHSLVNISKTTVTGATSSTTVNHGHTLNFGPGTKHDHNISVNGSYKGNPVITPHTLSSAPKGGTNRINAATRLPDVITVQQTEHGHGIESINTGTHTHSGQYGLSESGNTNGQHAHAATSTTVGTNSGCVYDITPKCCVLNFIIRALDNDR